MGLPTVLPQMGAFAGLLSRGPVSTHGLVLESPSSASLLHLEIPDPTKLDTLMRAFGVLSAYARSRGGVVPPSREIPPTQTTGESSSL